MLARKKPARAPVDAPLPSAPRFQEQIGRTSRLADCVELFEQALSGIGGADHSCCRLVLERHAMMLFGNNSQHSDRVSAAAQSGGWDIETPLRMAARRNSREMIVIFPIQMLTGDPLVVTIGYDALPDAATDRSLRARLHALAIAYAHRSLTLWEIEEDIGTSTPLTLKERIAFAMILSGYPYFEIAGRLGCSPAAVASHVESATARLEAPNTTAAVALAARRGWLHLPQLFKK